MSEELRLCSCGAEIDPDNNPNRYTDEVLERNNWQVEWWVECDDCLCRGPIAGTPAEAVRLWNSRPIEHKLLAENEQLKGMRSESGSTYGMTALKQLAIYQSRSNAGAAPSRKEDFHHVPHAGGYPRRASHDGRQSWS